MVTKALFVAGVLSTCSAAEASSYTVYTAPDAASRAALVKPIIRLNDGAPRGIDSSPTIHNNFPKIIEQNFARLDSEQMAILVDSLSEAELSDLAQLYTTAVADNGNSPLLFNVLAHRLDPARLGRLSRHFGFASIYAAITVISPSKTQNFIESSSTEFLGPRPGAMRFGPNGIFAAPKTIAATYSKTFYRPTNSPKFFKMQGTAGFGQFMNYTPYEIYLSFRTAPIGALAVTGALWETAVVLSSTLIPAYVTGAAIGTYVVAPLVQSYAPDLWNSIGSGIASLVNMLTNSWPGGVSTAGPAQPYTASIFQSTTAQISLFEYTGGDFQASWDWGLSSGFLGTTPGGGGGGGSGGGGSGGGDGGGGNPDKPVEEY